MEGEREGGWEVQRGGAVARGNRRRKGEWGDLD